MPYHSNEDLPEPVRHSLPAHGQDIYRKAFNNALEEYQNSSKRRSKSSAETTAHKVAWAAVKAKYHKDKQGNWKSNEG